MPFPVTGVNPDRQDASVFTTVLPSATSSAKAPIRVPQVFGIGFSAHIRRDRYQPSPSQISSRFFPGFSMAETS